MDVKLWQKRKRQRKKAKKEPAAAECVENLLAIHTLQVVLLSRLKETMQPKRKLAVGSALIDTP